MKLKHVVASLLLMSAVGVGGYGYYKTNYDGVKPQATEAVKAPSVAPTVIPPAPPAKVTEAPSITPPSAQTTPVSQVFVDGEFNLDNISLITPKAMAQKVSAILEGMNDAELGTEVGQAILIGKVQKLDEEINGPILMAVEKQYLQTATELARLKKKEEGIKARREYELLLAEVDAFKRVSQKRNDIAFKAFRQGEVRDLVATRAIIEKNISDRIKLVDTQQGEKFDARLKELGELEARRWGVYNNAKVKVKDTLELLKTNPDSIDLKIQLADAEQAVLIAWEGPEGVQVVRTERGRMGEEKRKPGVVLQNARKSIMDAFKPMVDNKTYLNTYEKFNKLNEEVKAFWLTVSKKRDTLPKE